MNRRDDTLLPLEEDILSAALSLRRRGVGEFYGFKIAKEIQDKSGARSLTGHGTLYKALARLEGMGMLTSRWEDPGQAALERRPVRRLYEITGVGEQALASSPRGIPASKRVLNRRPAPA